VEAIIRSRLSEASIVAIAKQAAAEFIELSKTGRSRIKKDRSAIA
jgi:hypothetical protein